MPLECAFFGFFGEVALRLDKWSEQEAFSRVCFLIEASPLAQRLCPVLRKDWNLVRPLLCTAPNYRIYNKKNQTVFSSWKKIRRHFWAKRPSASESCVLQIFFFIYFNNFLLLIRCSCNRNLAVLRLIAAGFKRCSTSRSLTIFLIQAETDKARHILATVTKMFKSDFTTEPAKTLHDLDLDICTTTALGRFRLDTGKNVLSGDIWQQQRVVRPGDNIYLLKTTHRFEPMSLIQQQHESGFNDSTIDRHRSMTINPKEIAIAAVMAKSIPLAWMVAPTPMGRTVKQPWEISISSCGIWKP